ncbi:hypothetical protein AO057_08010 [Curvibacter sp. PAE-UM]|nr:hypothetical protein AO057_08010 [Curvibacter sp. PAE-UM]
MTQRRNTAYLNRQISRAGHLDRDLDVQAPRLEPDLRLISMARSIGASDPMTSVLPTWTDCFLDCAAVSKGKLLEKISPIRSKDLCVLT